MRLPSLSVKARIAGTCALLLAVTLVGVAGVVVDSTGDSARRSAEQLTVRTAEQQAALVDAELQRAFGTARDLAGALSAVRATGASRAQADRVQRELLAANEGLLGVWTGWEPQAWDGRDAAFVGRPGHDASGRYVPYWYRDGDRIAHDVLTGYTEDGAGDYYRVPQRTGVEKVVDPYPYEVGGREVLITSAGVPVRVGDRVAGVAGIDIALSTIQEQVAGIRVYGTGRATLLSTGGLVVAGPDAEQVGEQASGALRAVAEDAARGSVATTAGSGDAEVLRVATPLRLGASDVWTLVVDVPTSAVLADAHALRRTVVVISLLALALAAGLSMLAARRLVRPVDVLRERLEQISEGDGDLTQRVDESAEDEIGALGRAFNRFVEKVAVTVREITGTAGELTAAASSLEAVARRLAEGTEATAAGTARLSAASAQVDAGVQTVATATEEMGATAREIASGASSASRMAADGVAAAAAAGSTVAALGSSSAEIGDVVRVITSIAEQTNLLALNATIEAARAGEAGKGFAVVANEVKDLAQETARATGDITAKVEALQSAAERAGEALARITQAIGSVDETQTSIATAVEEQAATVQSLAQTVTQAADGTASIATGIADVDALAADTSGAAEETGAAARDLQRLADRLGTLVGDFRC